MLGKSEIVFWCNIEIPVEDFIEDSNKNFTSFTRSMFNRFKDKSPNWVDILNLKEKDDKSKRKKLRELYKNGDLNFLRAYCCSWFTHKMGNPLLVNSFANKFLKKELYNKYKDDDQILTYFLYLKEMGTSTNLLFELYFEHFLQKTNLDVFIGDIKKPTKSGVKLNKEIVQKILDKFEKKRKTKRKKSVVWWFKEDDNSWYIVFRRSKLRGVPIKLLNRNHFIRTADLKIFKINKDFKIVEIYTKKEPKRMAKCASFIANEIADIEVNYEKQERTYNTENVNKFLADIVTKNTHKITILEIAIRNFPLTSSPTLILKSEGDTGINEALDDLRDDGKLPNEREFIILRFIYNNRKYHINLNRFGDETGVGINQRGLSMNDRQVILNFLDTVFS